MRGGCNPARDIINITSTPPHTHIPPPLCYNATTIATITTAAAATAGAAAAAAAAT